MKVTLAIDTTSNRVDQVAMVCSARLLLLLAYQDVFVVHKYGLTSCSSVNKYFPMARRSAICKCDNSVESGLSTNTSLKCLSINDSNKCSIPCPLQYEQFAELLITTWYWASTWKLAKFPQHHEDSIIRGCIYRFED